jgi:hypothetical protein
MKSKDLKIGSIVEYCDENKIWKESIVYKCTATFVWFKASGYVRIARSTFDNFPQLYIIKTI